MELHGVKIEGAWETISSNYLLFVDGETEAQQGRVGSTSHLQQSGERKLGLHATSTAAFQHGAHSAARWKAPLFRSACLNEHSTFYKY